MEEARYALFFFFYFRIHSFFFSRLLQRRQVVENACFRSLLLHCRLLLKFG